MIWEQFKWSLFRRRVLQRSALHFKASIFSYVDNRVAFEGFNDLYAYSKVATATLGLFTYVAEGAKVVNTDVGRFCSIGPGALIGGLGVHPTNLISTHPVFYSLYKQAGAMTFASERFMEELPRVTVGNDVWIGARAIILDGVTIGNGAIVAAGAVVSQDIEPFAIVGGVPARLLRMRFDEDTIALLEECSWWDWPLENLRKWSPLFRMDAKLAVVQLQNEKFGG